MAFTSNSLPISTTHTSISPLHSHSATLRKRLRNWKFRAWRRRRLKLNPKLDIRNDLSSPPPPSPFEDFFQNFLSSLSNPLTSQKLIPPTALGFASGLALSLSKLNSKAKSSKSRVCEVGEWILFTSPTPFNRFVLLRCPTITFEGSEFLENVNDKLVKEERHYVRLDSGKIQASSSDDDGHTENHQLEYQRVCVGTDDGGVISLDWPANLDLNEERGLDTTLLLIPGTAEGSMDEDVRGFVCGCLKRGLFPVVMNPRGCAGSPLTTPRLFTAADSDDICSTVQFLNRARPWSTMMGVGWGYGANMLTKYLAEAGEKTPLTAATCIDNPFDLEEATRTSTYHSMFDRKLTRGLTNILKSNKELFQGRSKYFNVEDALSAESVRDFEKAISMVSYGFDSIEDFYSKSSTRSMAGDLKIPVLFIQNDNGAVPLFSIPRGLIAENPYTSLILCSYLPSAITASSRSVTSWCQQLSIEWLTAVELGLLKGRHPLLPDVDVTINPSNGLALVEGRTSETIGVNVSNFSQPESSKRLHLDPMTDMPEEHDSAAATSVSPAQGSNSNLERDDRDLKLLNASLAESSYLGVESDDGADSEDIDKGQVLQTAQVVMNMLDVAMPGTLQEEEKKKVLDTVGQGETIVKALQDAVPEDVRGKLTASVSEILHVQGKSLNFDGLARIGQMSNVSSRLKFKVEEKVGKHSSTQNNLFLDEKRTANDVGNDHVDGEATANTSSSDNDNNQMQEKSPRSMDPSNPRPLNSYGDDVAAMKKGVNESLNILDSNESAKENVPQQSNEDSSETSLKTIVSSQNENPRRYEEASVSQGIEHGDGLTGPLGIKDESNVLGADGRQKDSSSFKPFKRHEDGDTSQLGNKDESNMLGREEKREDSSGFKQDTKQEDGETGQLDMSNMSGRDERRQDSSGLKLDSKHEDGAIGHLDVEGERNVLDKGGKRQDSSEDQKKANSPTNWGEVVSHPNSSDAQGSEKAEDGRNKDGKTLQPIPDQNNPAPDIKVPSFSVSQAFDALTGLDDSTQVAVNSVFGVIENMIDQLEEAKKDGKLNDEEESNANNDISSNSTDKHSVSTEHQFEEPKYGKDFERLWPPGITSVETDNNGGASGDDENAISHQENNRQSENIVVGKLFPKIPSGQRNMCNLPMYLTSNAHAEGFHNEYLHKYILSKEQTAKPLDLDATAALFLDYIPEEGQWKLMDHPRSPVHISGIENNECMNTVDGAGSLKKKIVEENIIEPSYVIFDSERPKELVEEFEMVENLKSQVVSGSNEWHALEHVKNVVMESLKLEVGRRIGAEDIKEMDDAIENDIEAVANAICSAIKHDEEHTWHYINSNVDQSIKESSRFQSEHIVEAISSVVKDKAYLRRVLPIGVIVGSCLASLRKYFDVSVRLVNDEAAVVSLKGKDINWSKPKAQPFEAEIADNPALIGAQNTVPEVQSDAGIDNEDKASVGLDREKPPVRAINRDTVMVGAVTAALGASAFITQQQGALKGSEIIETSSKSSVKKEFLKESVKLEEATDDKHQNNIVTNLAEKAMSVAAPMVPTKEGEVDQERLVSMLAELGQKGGMLRLVGKIALLWGGVRGAISLTDRLITFSRISERPLFQRVVGFVSMVVILWSPVVVPLLPTIVQNWTTHRPSKIVDLVCAVGLYTAVTILIMLWGKRIRRHENPLRQYGLDLSSSQKVPDFLTGLAGGVMLVLSIHTINAFLGYACFSWPVNLSPSSFDLMAKLKAYSQLLFLAVRGTVTATCVALVEELLFRSWLPEEIAADLGYHQGIIISGLVFSLSQRSLHSIPGLWLLSLCLAGARQRNHGQLFIPVGLRSGIVATSILLHIGGFLTYRPDFPIWLIGHPFQPFSGLIGLLFALSLAIVLYPRELSLRKKRTIRE